MATKSWLACLLASVLCVGMAHAADAKKEEPKKEEKKDDKPRKNVAAAAATKTAFDARYKGAEILEVKCKPECCEIKAKDQWNKSFKVVYTADAKLCHESNHHLPSANLPPAVAESVKKWAPNGKLVEMAEMETEKGKPTTYDVRVWVGGKKLLAVVAEDGKIVEADKLPEPKAEKKKEEKKKDEPKKEEKK